MKKTHRLVALLLCLCLLLALVPLSAFAEEEIVYNSTITLSQDDMDNWAQIKSDFENATLGQKVQVVIKGDVRIPEPLKNKNGASFYIVGEGENASVAPQTGSDGDTSKFVRQEDKGTVLLSWRFR